MSHFVDYSQTAEDHQSLLVLVHHLGTQLHPQGFHRAMEKISAVDCIHVQGQKRYISVRYKKSYCLDFNSWGDFQAHRKVLGLVAVGKCTDQTEFEDLFASYKSLKEEYSSSIINSRLIVYGLNTDGTPLEDDSTASQDKNKSSEDGKKESSGGGEETNKSPHHGSLQPVRENEEENSHVPKTLSNVSHKPNGVSPSEASTKDSEKRTHSNSLTKESSGSEIVFYPSLDSSHDLAERMKEFVTSLYYVIEGKRLDRSFERSDKLILLCAPFEKKDYIGVDTDTKSFRKKCMGRLRKQLGDLCLQAAMPGEAILHYNTAHDLLKAVNDFLWMAGCLEGLCCANIILAYPKTAPVTLRRNLSFQAKRGSPTVDVKARTGSGYANGLDVSGDYSSPSGPNLEDVVEKYKEAITLYSKFLKAAMVEMEASLKACRFLIMQRKYLQASDFLKNVVYINLPSQEEDRIQRYNTLSSLYTQIGFHRKAAFFKRVSGMHCVAPDSSQSWDTCYDLFLKSLEGYSLSVNPREINTDQPHGWPVLQYRVLHELVYSARRMNNPQIAVRHMTLLVHVMLPFLNVSDQREALTGLASLTAKCPGTTHPLALESGLILPPVPLLGLPIIRSFRLVPPSPHLQPNKIGSVQHSSSSGGGVFIYTPLSLGNKSANDSKPDFQWVCGDVCEASLQVVNPLADELNISYMGLLAGDFDLEVFPSNAIVPAGSNSQKIKLMAKPKAVGTLQILGYTTVVFGVKSNCRLRDLPNLRPSPMTEITIEVIPPLPQVALSCTLPKSTVFSNAGNTADVVATGSASLLAGQSSECVVTLQNTSHCVVENLSVRLNARSDLQASLSRIVSWCDENVQSQLPLAPLGQLCFSLYIYGDSDFLQPSDLSKGSISRSRSESFDTREKTIDTVLSLQYSGGDGLQAGYCRQCSLALNIEIMPSVFITRWDVQTADDPQMCRLCLDLTNVSSHHMDILGTDQAISLEPHQTRRVSVQVPRLDSSQVDMSLVEENRVPAHYRTRSSPDPYSQSLAKYVDIQWSVPSAQLKGKVAIDYIRWTPEQLTTLLLPHIHWDVRLNSHVCLPSSRLTFGVGEQIEVKVTVENVCEQDWQNVTLTLNPWQRHSATDLGIDQSSMVAMGATTQKYDNLCSKKRAVHACSFVFFSPGFYGLDLACHQHSVTLEEVKLEEVEETKGKVRPTSFSNCDSKAVVNFGSSPSSEKWTAKQLVRFEIT